jgi:hypothetical protein
MFTYSPLFTYALARSMLQEHKSTRNNGRVFSQVFRSSGLQVFQSSNTDLFYCVAIMLPCVLSVPTRIRISVVPTVRTDGYPAALERHSLVSLTILAHRRNCTELQLIPPKDMISIQVIGVLPLLCCNPLKHGLRRLAAEKKHHAFEYNSLTPNAFMFMHVLSLYAMYEAVCIGMQHISTGDGTRSRCACRCTQSTYHATRTKNADHVCWPL